MTLNQLVSSLAHVLRRSKCIAVLLGFLLILGSNVPLLNVPSFADTYTITNYDIEIQILSDGSADVTERITYDFNGAFNGIYYNLDLSGSGGIESQTVAVETEDGLRYHELSNSELNGTYLFSESEGYARFKVFERSVDTIKTFVYTYHMLDAVTVYSDTAEYNRKIIGTKWDVPIHNVTAHIFLPDKTIKENVLVFSHGPLTGNSARLEDGTTAFDVDLVPMGEFFEARVLFPTEMVPDARHVKAQAVRDKILADEQKLADEANAARDKAKKDLASVQTRRKIGSLLMPLFLLLWVASLIWNQMRLGRPPKGTFDGRYFRDLPGEYAPTDLYYLMHHESAPTFNEISATLLDLVRRGVIRLEMKNYMKKGFLRTSAQTDFIFTIPESGLDKKSITDTEKSLIDWLFSSAGSGTEMSLDGLKEYFSKSRSGDGVELYLSTWKNYAKNQAKTKGFFVERTAKYVFKGIAPALFFILSGLIMTLFFTYWGLLLFVLALLSIIHFGRQKHFTPYGWDQYMKWKGFKRFIHDFSRIEDAVIPSIAIWEHYLVFGMTLGIAKKVIQAFPKQIYSENVGSYPVHSYMLTRALISEDGGMDKLSDHFESFTDHMDQTMKVANSHTSSGSGFGGGSSGGSSGGGGGGSGGGAF